MITKQPRWRRVANLGDVHPIEYGGYFVYVDRTGVYAPEAEWLEAPDGDVKTWTLYRFALDRCTLTVDPNNAQYRVLSDNKFHPLTPAWFANPENGRADRPQDSTYLSNVANFADIPLDELRSLFCSEDPVDRAVAYRAVGQYHGFENLDQYPQTYTKRSDLPRRIRRGK